MKDQTNNDAGYSVRCRKNSTRIILWSIAFAGTLVLANKAVLYEWYTSDLIAIGAVVLNALAGIGLIFAFIRSLKEGDDLQRKIQLDALSVAMGVALVGGFSYSLLVTSGFIIDEEVTDITLLMVVAYMVAVIAGQVRYR